MGIQQSIFSKRPAPMDEKYPGFSHPILNGQRCNCKAGSTLFIDNAHICQEKSIDEHFIFGKVLESARLDYSNWKLTILWVQCDSDSKLKYWFLCCIFLKFKNIFVKKLITIKWMHLTMILINYFHLHWK